MSDEADRIAAYTRLVRECQPDLEPKITATELETIVRNNARSSWTANTAITLGTVIRPATRNGHYYIATEEGTTGSTEPTFPTNVADTVTDGTVEWTEHAVDTGTTVDIRSAAREVWALKMTKAVEMIQSSDSGSEQMIFQHCEEMYYKYQTPMIA